MNPTLKIQAQTASISQILSQSFQIDVYQREYAWESKHIDELLADLKNRFLTNYRVNHGDQDLFTYKPYFMGSLIINTEAAIQYIVDGQQRLTSLTLLLIYLNKLRGKIGVEERQFIDLSRYIFGSSSSGLPSQDFNLNVQDRTKVMNYLYWNEGLPDEEDLTISDINILSRYQNIETMFSDELKTPHAFRLFTSWLLNSVLFSRIDTTDSSEANFIFETMNDRGLNLDNADKLKAFLISEMKDPVKRAEGNETWKAVIQNLKQLGRRNSDNDFFKAWLRAKYAVTIRSSSVGATNQDFEIIGTEFHRWVRDNVKDLGLQTTDDFEKMINVEIPFFAEQYIRLVNATKKHDPQLPYPYFNAQLDFSLQHTLALTPLQLSDSPEIILKKVRLVTGYLDIFLARRVVNKKPIARSSIEYTMYNLIKEIRNQDVKTLITIFESKIREMDAESDPITFAAISQLRYSSNNRNELEYLLGRITYHIEIQSDQNTNIDFYLTPPYTRKKNDIEHIIADKYEEYTSDYKSEEEFQQQRNRFAALLLIRSTKNRSYGAMPYKEKRELYLKENLLAQSLHPYAYQNDKNFKAYRERSKLGFEPYDKFGKYEIDKREILYRAICEEIWNPKRLREELN